MTFAGRIRLYLVAIALLPPVLMMVVVYFYSAQQEEIRYRQDASTDLIKLDNYRRQFDEDLTTTINEVTSHSWFERSVRLAGRGRASQISFDDLLGFDLDFCELLDSTGTVVASAHRPGLVGTVVVFAHEETDGTPLYETVEYDVAGRHAALSGFGPTVDGFRVNGGRYLETIFVPVSSQLIRGRITTTFADGDEAQSIRPVAATDSAQLYRSGEALQAQLVGRNTSPFTLTVEFIPPDESAVFSSFIDVVTIVALVSVLAAIGLGLYISGRARREFENLIDAFARVAKGDLNTPVMAYSEGEFSNLADSFSAMTQKLRRSQQQLATTEKIAAWQAMARKIAHEIKNPLTPIGISASDLRRSYAEKLPGFDQTLDKSTRMINSEVNRLSKLLDEFVSFARMKPPEIRSENVACLVEEVAGLYASEIAAGRVTLKNRSGRPKVRVDAAMIKQLLVNLIKNGLESSDSAVVKVELGDTNGDLRIAVSDSGPGFPEEILQRKFEPYLSTKSKGSGLGLVICQRIVHDHGGRIELNNGKDGGAEVVVVLPQT
jgi:signal transduction histidine kinase